MGAIQEPQSQRLGLRSGIFPCLIRALLVNADTSVFHDESYARKKRVSRKSQSIWLAIAKHLSVGDCGKNLSSSA